MDIPYFFLPVVRMSLVSFPEFSARADWIELLRISGQTLLSVPNWDAVVSSLPKTTTNRKPSPILSMRDISPSQKTESSSGGMPRSDYPITTERAAIVSRFVEDVVFGKGIEWDLSVAGEEVKAKKKKGKK
jgi:hypothetical protein